MKESPESPRSPLTAGVCSRAIPGQKYRLTVPLKPPSKNDLRPNSIIVRVRNSGAQLPLAWLKLKNAEREWSRWIPHAARLLARGPRRVTFTIIRKPGQIAQDEWNLTTGLNLVLMDELVRKGWLVDDRIACVDLPRPVQREALPGESFPVTIIELEDLPV